MKLNNYLREVVSFKNQSTFREWKARAYKYLIKKIMYILGIYLMSV